MTLQGESALGTPPSQALDVNGTIRTNFETSVASSSSTGHVLGYPAAGMWSAAGTSTSATEDAKFNGQLENPDSAYFGSASNQRYIQIKKAGWYLVMADVEKHSLTDGELGEIQLHRDNLVGTKQQTMCRAYANGSGTSTVRLNLSCSVVERFNTFDRVVLYDANSNNAIVGGSTISPLWDTTSQSVIVRSLSPGRSNCRPIAAV